MKSQELLRQNFESIFYEIEGIIHQGLLNVSCADRITRSLFSLQLAKALSEEDNLFGFAIPENKSIAYLSYHFSEAEVQEFIKDLDYTSQSDVNFYFNQAKDMVFDIKELSSIYDIIFIDSLESHILEKGYIKIAHLKNLCAVLRRISEYKDTTIILLTDCIDRNLKNPISCVRGKSELANIMDTVLALQPMNRSWILQVFGKDPRQDLQLGQIEGLKFELLDNTFKVFGLDRYESIKGAYYGS